MRLFDEFLFSIFFMAIGLVLSMTQFPKYHSVATLLFIFKSNHLILVKCSIARNLPDIEFRTGRIMEGAEGRKGET